MATVLVGLVHFHYGPFVNECLFFSCKSVGFSEIKRCYACRRYRQQDSQMQLGQFNEGFVHVEYTRLRQLFFQLIFRIMEFLEVEAANCCRSPRRKAFPVLADEMLTVFMELEAPLRQNLAIL
jgi:hypothetical protein